MDYTVRLTHPVTGRFVAEYDPARQLLLVKDRGQEAVIDLARIAGTAYTGGTAIPVID
jgi:hypothetical protein